MAGTPGNIFIISLSPGSAPALEVSRNVVGPKLKAMLVIAWGHECAKSCKTPCNYIDGKSNHIIYVGGGWCYPPAFLATVSHVVNLVLPTPPHKLGVVFRMCDYMGFT